MVNVKNVTYSLTATAFMALVISGFYNTARINSDEFMHIESNILSHKRLDEINGKIVVGRMAASSINWQTLDKVEVNKHVEKVVSNKMIQQKVETQIKDEKLPEPAITEDLDLYVSNAFFKKPLDNRLISGRAKVYDGYIEEIFLSLPDGESVEIQTVERMVGNVFTYEDTQTRELKSGMFYEVKQGTYMITFTNDSKYTGLRIELKSGEQTEVAYNEEDSYVQTGNIQPVVNEDY